MQQTTNYKCQGVPLIAALPPDTRQDPILKSYYGILTAHLLIFSSSSLEYGVWTRILATRNNAARL